MKSLLNEKDIGVIVIDNSDLFFSQKDCVFNCLRVSRPQFWVLGLKRIIPSESLHGTRSRLMKIILEKNKGSEMK